MICFIICMQTVTNGVKNFACGGLFSFLYFTFAHDFINCMFTTVTDVVKNFACGVLFSFLSFNFVHDLIHYLYANGDKWCKKISPAAGFSRSCMSISFMI